MLNDVMQSLSDRISLAREFRGLQVLAIFKNRNAIEIPKKDCWSTIVGVNKPFTLTQDSNPLLEVNIKNVDIQNTKGRFTLVVQDADAVGTAFHNEEVLSVFEFAVFN